MKRAAQFAAQAHRGQTRKDGRTPYINHPVRVALALRASGMLEQPVLEAALLHDVIEDCGVSRMDIAAQFGREVADLVSQVTDDKSLAKGERKLAQLTARYSYRAACIKVADKLVNVQDIMLAPPPWPQARKLAYIEHARMLVGRLRAEYRLPLPLLAAFDRTVQAAGQVGLALA